MMTKRLLLSILILPFLITLLFGQNETAEQEYIKAMQAKSNEQKAQLLKEYISKYKGKGTKYEQFAFANLCLTPYKGKTPQETIEYGEQALSLGGLDDLTKIQVLVSVSGLYSQLNKNLDRAKNYAAEVIQIAKKNKNSSEPITSIKHLDKMIGIGYFLQGQVLEKQNSCSQAVDNYEKAYKILKDMQIIKNVKNMGLSLYKNKSYRSAEKAFKLCASVLKDYDIYVFYAKSLYKNSNKNLALNYFKKAYSQQKKGDVAFNIGMILASKAKSDSSFTDEAVKYLLEASFLSNANSQKARQYAQSLYFSQYPEYNENVKKLQESNERLEKLTEEFNEKFSIKTQEELT
ncbi:MAG: hypothetical protein ACOC5F_05705, partial [Candidatus Aminicenantaceae bacterium]